MFYESQLKPCMIYAASPLHSKDFLERLRKALDRLTGESVEYRGLATDPKALEDALRGCKGALIVVSTGGTEHILVEGLRDYNGYAVLVAHPYANSLAALMEAVPLLKGRRIAPMYIGSLTGEDARRLIEASVRSLSATARLSGSRLGLIGEPSPWLVYSRLLDQAAVKERLGAELVEVPLDEVYERYEKARVDSELVEKILKGAVEADRPQNEVEKALRLYEALKSIVKEKRLDGFTIECFELIPKLRTTACLAVSLFNSSGVVAGCEGDVPGFITMALLTWVSDRPAFMANPAEMGDRWLLLAHCTAPIAYGPYKLMTHFESGMGVGLSVEVASKGSTVTIARLSPELDRLRVIRGVVEKAGLFSNLHCRTQVRVRLESDPHVLLEDSIGNHYVMVPGDYALEMKAAAQLLGIRYELL
jgi:L-fucose isomerase-like protein